MWHFVTWAQQRLHLQEAAYVKEGLQGLQLLSSQDQDANAMPSNSPGLSPSSSEEALLSCKSFMEIYAFPLSSSVHLLEAF